MREHRDEEVVTQEEADIQQAVQASIQARKEEFAASAGMARLSKEAQLQLLNQKLALKQLELVDVTGKGNCFFDAARLHIVSTIPSRARLCSCPSRTRHNLSGTR